MKKSFVALSVLCIAFWVLMTGCASPSGDAPRPVAPGEQPGAKVVYEAPPPPQQQAPVAAPGPEYAYSWIPGYWTWKGQWVWANGTWVPRPSPHAEWVPGQWAKRGHRYIWIRGRWQ